MQARQQIVQRDNGAGEIQAWLKFHILLELHTPAVVILMSFVKRLFQSLQRLCQRGGIRRNADELRIDIDACRLAEFSR